jgi:hypothetical protein
MLRELLKHVPRSGATSTAELAAQLGTTPRMIAAMIQDLVRLGYLVPSSPQCSQCSSCSMSKGCIKDTDQKTWMLVDRENL